MKAALYLRVSTEDQAKDGFSIAAQRERLTAYAQSQDWEIYDYYIDDGYSAKDMKRPAFQRMLKDAEERKVNVILVHKLDRFTRSVRDLYEVLERMNKWDVSFRSSQEQFDTTSTIGRAMIGMLGIFAQWERETIADRVYWGMEQKIMEGKRNGAQAPLGYSLDNGKLVPNEQADFVRRLFGMYLSGMGMPTMAMELAKEGTFLNIHTMKYILQNPIYCGRYRWNYRKKGNRTKNPIIVDGIDAIPLISTEEFDRAQEILKLRVRVGKASTSEFLFSGIIKCARCGFPMTAGIRRNKSEDLLFYRCSGRTNYGRCDMPRLRESAVEDALFSTLQMDKKEISQLIQVKDRPNNQTDLKKINRELEQIKKRKEKWRTAYVNELITIEELRMYTDKERDREEELLLEQEKAKEDNDAYMTPAEIHAIFRDIHRAWGQIEDRQSKKMFLQDIFSEIKLDTDATEIRSGQKNHYGCYVKSWKLNN